MAVATLATALAVAGDVEWLWPGWIANGFVTLVAGRKGLGKSTLALDLMGKTLLLGGVWPDGTPTAPRDGYLLWLEAEAGQAMNAQRARAMGAPLDRIQLFSPDPSVLDPMQHFFLSPENGKWVLEKLSDPACVGCVVDALSGIHNDDENSSRLGKAVLAFANFSRDSNKPVVILHHKSKRKRDQDGNFLDDGIESVRGSSAIYQYTRIVAGIEAPNGDNVPPYRLCQYANNLMPIPDPIGYKLSSRGPVYCEPPPSAGATVRSFTVGWLSELLSKGPISAADVIAAAAANAIPERTLNRAKASLGVVTERHGNVWVWRLA